VREQRHALAFEGATKLRVGEQPVDTEFHDGQSAAGSSSAKQVGIVEVGFSGGCASAQ
jgi:hypothetical protein